jgi:hypothetical protein
VSSHLGNDRTARELDRLVHAMRQPLSALMLLVDVAQRQELPDELRPTIVEMGKQVAAAVAASRQLSMSIQASVGPDSPRSGDG